MPNPEVKALAKQSLEFPLREDFLNSLGDVKELEPASLVLLGTDSETQEPFFDIAPIATAEFVHVQSVQIPQEERVQMAIGVGDEGKLYTYGRTTRMYAVSGFIVDSNRADGGHAMARWDHLYENFFRMTACLENEYIAKFRWRLTTSYGYLLSNIKGIESTQPSVCMVNFTFISLFDDDELKKTPSIVLEEGADPIAGKASYESLDALDLVPNLVGIYQKAAVTLAATAVGKALAKSAKYGRKRIADFVGSL